MKVKAPTEKNFRRAKVKPGKRKTARPWLSWRVLRIPLLVVLLVYAAHRATSLVLNASALKVTRIIENSGKQPHIWRKIGRFGAGKPLKPRFRLACTLAQARSDL